MERSTAEDPRPWQLFMASSWDMSFPWTLIVSAVLGLRLMFVPALVGNATPLAHTDHLAGALIITALVIGVGEVVRPFRYLDVGLGAAAAGLP